MSAGKRRAEGLAALRSLGPAALEDLRLLSVDSVEALARCEPERLYAELCRRKGGPVDICCLDVFSCAVAQARDPHLPEEQRNWFWWSRRPKAAARPPQPKTSPVHE